MHVNLRWNISSWTVTKLLLIHVHVCKYIKITVTFISISAGYILFIFSFVFMKSNSIQMNTMQMKTASIACISWDHQKTTLLINEHVAGRIWYFLRHVSLSLSMDLKMALSVYFLTMGMCDSSNLFTLYYMVYTCILGDNDAIIWSVYHQIEYTPAF